MMESNLNKLANTFEVLVLAGDFDAVLKNRLIPPQLFRQLRETNNILLGERGWNLTEKGKEMLREYAKTHITPEQQKVLKLLLKQKQEEEAKINLANKIMAIGNELDDLEIETGQLLLANGEAKYIPQGEVIADPRDPGHRNEGWHWWVIESDRVLSIYNSNDLASISNAELNGVACVAVAMPKSQQVLELLEFLKNNRVEIKFFERAVGGGRMWV